MTIRTLRQTVSALTVALLMAGAQGLRAEETAPPPKATEGAPAADGATKNNDDATKNNGEPLSEKLKKSEGVLKPPDNVDPEIHKAPPETTKDKMPVIVPPGEPGGDQSVQPK